MNIQIYQIDFEKDKDKVKFASLSTTMEYSGQVDPSIYSKVFDGEVECENLEEVFAKFNSDDEKPGFTGHSMSVSDVVKLDDEAFFCDSIGFKKIDFDESMIKSDMIKVLVVEPKKVPYKAEIHNTLQDMQKTVGGLIDDFYPFADNAFIILNDEGKIHGMEGNRRIGGSVICGTFFVVGDTNEGECCSLTDEQIEKYEKFFHEPQEISQAEIEADSYMIVTTLE